MTLFLGTNTPDTLISGVENDTLVGREGDDSLVGNTGNDSFVGEDGNDTLISGAGNDILNGSDGNDSLVGNAGNDLFFGDEDNDILIGGIGNDTLSGGDGDDSLVGTAGNDLFFGDEDSDTLTGGIGNDTLSGGDGNDSLVGNASNDILFGEAGNDTLTGGIGNNILSGGDGDDSLFGTTGNDIFFGEAGNDILTGGAGNNILSGGAGDDSVFGGNGDDRLFGIGGNNTLTGGNGADIFGIGFAIGSGQDTITDFVVGTDKIGIPSSLDIATLNEQNFDFSEPNVLKITLSDSRTPVALVNYTGTVPTTGNSSDFLDLLLAVDEVSSVLEFSETNFSVNEEGVPIVSVTVTRTGDSRGAVSATINLSNNTAIAQGDYNNAPIQVNFAAGQTTQTVNVPIVDDTLVEQSETINLTLVNPTDGATIGSQNTATLTIVDNDVSLQFSAANFSVNENGTAIAAVTVTRSGVVNKDVSATINLSNGTAIALGDYNNAPIQVNFAAGETTQTVNIPIVDDAFVEDSETINLALVNPTNGATLGSQNTATLSIVNNDVSVQFSAPTFSVTEGTPIVDITLTRTGVLDGAVSGTVTLTNGSATASQDYNNAPIQVNFAPGEATKALSIPIVDDTTFEGTETINLTLGNFSENVTIGTPNVAILEIKDNDTSPTPTPTPTPTPAPTPTPTPTPRSPGTLEFSNASFLVNENGTPLAAVTVNRTNGSFGAVSATIALSNGTAIAGSDYANTPITVSFADGDTTSKIINIPIINDTLVEVSEFANLALINPTGGAVIGTQNSASLTIARSDMPALLDFEAVGNLKPVAASYAAQGISFSPNALGIIDTDALDALGRTDEFGGNFGTPPSGITALTYGEGSAIVMDVAGGFDSKLSFFYASPFRDHTVKIYDAPGATGNLLAAVPLGRTPAGEVPDAYSTFNEIAIPFSGIARSVTFGDVANKIVIDSIGLG